MTVIECNVFAGRIEAKIPCNIENTSDGLMQDWYAFFFTPDGQEAYTCYQGYDTFPAIPAGNSRNVTFSVYVEQDQVVDYGVVVDSELGESNVLEFPLRR